MLIPNGELNRLRALASELMATQQLPAMLSNSLLAGYGTGALCSLCGQPINPTEIEYELPGPTPSESGTRLHLWCHTAWQTEIENARMA